MANAKKCDRCGSYYDHNVRVRAPKGGFLGAIETLTSNMNDIKCYDLCDNCAEDLMRFIAGDGIQEE